MIFRKNRDFNELPKILLQPFSMSRQHEQKDNECEENTEQQKFPAKHFVNMF